MTKTLLTSSLAIVLLAGCVDYQLVAYDPEKNFLAFDHPFTDKAIADVLARAKKLCEERKQVAIQTTKMCSLTKCTTNYQCVDAADVYKYGL